MWLRSSIRFRSIYSEKAFILLEPVHLTVEIHLLFYFRLNTLFTYSTFAFGHLTEIIFNAKLIVRLSFSLKILFIAGFRLATEFNLSYFRHKCQTLHKQFIQ